MLNFKGFDNLLPYFSFAQSSLNEKDIFFVGGVIRDIILGIKTDNFEDIDITLSKDPKQVFEQIDKNSGSIFKTDKFGTITIVNKEQSCQYEITPFREEGTYSDSRHPDELKWTNSLLKDSIRRDFTINCLYYTFVNDDVEGGRNDKDGLSDIEGFDIDLLSDKKGEEKFLKSLKKDGFILLTSNLKKIKYPILIVQDNSLIEKILKDGKINIVEIKKLIGVFSNLHFIIDPHQGINDILNQKIKAVGNPDNRFNEDALRIIRAIRFVSILNQYDYINLDFDSKTWTSMKKYYFLLRRIAKERVIQEMKKVFKKGNAFGFIALMDELNILKYYFPALYNCKNNNQPTRYHPFDTYSHTILTLYHLQQINDNYLVRFGMLYHDVGKPDQYYWASIKKTEEEQKQLYSLDINHPIIGAQLAKEDFKNLGFSKKEIEEISFYVRYHMFPGELLDMGENKRKKEILKFISSYGLDRLLNLCDITIGDRLGQYNPLQHSNIEGVLELKKQINKIYFDIGRITLKDLKINGNDVVKLLGSPSPEVGQILNQLLEFVLEDEKRNKKHILLEKAKQIISKLN